MDVGLKCEVCDKLILKEDFHGDFYFCPKCYANYSCDGLPDDSKEELMVTDEWLIIAHLMGNDLVIPESQNK